MNIPAKWWLGLAISVAFAALVLFGGCANTVPADPSKLSAQQLEALAKDRGASAACTVANTPWGPARTIYVQLDRGVIPIGTVSVDAECKVSVQTATPPRAASAP